MVNREIVKEMWAHNPRRFSLSQQQRRPGPAGDLWSGFFYTAAVIDRRLITTASRADSVPIDDGRKTITRPIAARSPPGRLFSARKMVHNRASG
ncbi:hypothetical protein GWI33_015560 [Rhynchophorus ferrugineus]|uniref:Uncharacterized protein n=1 Tax=Rhynchophorus ferrugineus TaxID=354439 RepID=A0A834MBB0_RHYFE|nr:hypothetical protein GWI33_015560 [Rhynchophorus ferrugineus]